MDIYIILIIRTRATQQSTQNRREQIFLKKLPGIVSRHLKFVSLNLAEFRDLFIIIIHFVCAFGAHLGDNIP